MRAVPSITRYSRRPHALTTSDWIAIETLGSRRRLCSLRWSGIVPMTISSSSMPTQAEVTCGEPSGLIVTLVATAAEFRSSIASSESFLITLGRYKPRPASNPDRLLADLDGSPDERAVLRPAAVVVAHR